MWNDAAQISILLCEDFVPTMQENSCIYNTDVKITHKLSN